MNEVLPGTDRIFGKVPEVDGSLQSLLEQTKRQFDNRVVLNAATVAQPPPQGVGREVTPLVAEDARVFVRSFTVDTPQALYHTLLVAATELTRGVKGCSFQEARAHVAQGVKDRAALGEQKYGERLKAFNGRDPKVDLLQELLDALNYARQIIEELPL